MAKPGVLITQEGKEIPITWESFEDIRKMIGGYVEIVPSKEPLVVLLVDEEARLSTKKMNHTATAYSKRGALLGDVVAVVRMDLD